MGFDGTSNSSKPLSKRDPKVCTQIFPARVDLALCGTRVPERLVEAAQTARLQFK